MNSGTVNVKRFLTGMAIGLIGGGIIVWFLLTQLGSLLHWHQPAELPEFTQRWAGPFIFDKDASRKPPETDSTAPKSHPSLIEPIPLEPEVTREPPPLPESIESNIIIDLQRRSLLVPVQGVQRKALRSSFHEGRGNRQHQAMDILAPRNTPVLAVDDGKIARLFFSVKGGITLYQFDRTERYTYYYAHLERYAAGLKEGDRVRKGQVIGYVGTSGNAPPNTPHLHFAIMKLGKEKRWWEGEAIDPYLVLSGIS